ncbi:hypothetical protein V491_05412 [Pseudogymnoascus sp. VKM F-3775]|nr:hypothetical protein V491_05412 [Pseudogymnoascus sp. VKM F-3775]
MKQVMEWFADVEDPDFELPLSPLSIPLAIVYRDTNQGKKFFEVADKNFRSCCDALDDDVMYNDKPSYLMLAKILALLGLIEQSEGAFTKWCSHSSNLNPDEGEQREKADRTISQTPDSCKATSSSKTASLPAEKFSTINIE